MAQYIEVSGVSFGNGHTDNPTYAFSVGSGDIFLSGSGGYVNSPTGISKATLSSGIKLYLSSDTATAVTASVESGFTCTGQTAYATWVIPSPSPTPSPTPTPVESTVTFYVAEAVVGIPIWRANVAIEGTKTFNLDVSGSALGNEGTQTLFVVGSVTGNGTITVTRLSPDNTVDDLTTVEVIVNGGSIGVVPTGQQNITSGSVANESFTISNLTIGDDIRIEVYEG